MATLIRLKQIESGSALQTAAGAGGDFSASVISIISSSVVGVLPDGIISSSAQVNLLSASNYDGFVVQLDLTMSSDLQASIISSSISQSISVLSNTYATTASLNLLSSSANNRLSNLETTSASFNERFNTLQTFTASLDNTFATDYEVYVTASNIIDQGEW